MEMFRRFPVPLLGLDGIGAVLGWRWEALGGYWGCKTGGGGVCTPMLGATEVEVEEEWVWREDSKRGSHYCWLRRRLAAVEGLAVRSMTLRPKWCD